MAKIEQFNYLSPESLKLRKRDGTKPWQIHVCELDAFGWPLHPSHAESFRRHVAEVRKLREELERDD